MPDQSIAPGPDSPRVPKQPILVGHVVCCTQGDHADLKDWVHLRRYHGESYPVPDRVAHWFKTRRPWPEANLTIGECGLCKSTLAVCEVCQDQPIAGLSCSNGCGEERAA